MSKLVSFQGLLPNMGSLMFRCFFFFTAWICHMFSENNESCSLLFGKVYAVTLHLNNRHVFWWLWGKVVHVIGPWRSGLALQRQHAVGGKSPWSGATLRGERTSKPWNATGDNIWPVMGAAHWTLKASVLHCGFTLLLQTEKCPDWGHLSLTAPPWGHWLLHLQTTLLNESIVYHFVLLELLQCTVQVIIITIIIIINQ